MLVLRFLAISLVISSLSLSFSANPVSAAEYDAHEEFSNTNNPNGVWRYQGVATVASNTEGSYLLSEHGEIADTGRIGWKHARGGEFLLIGNDNGAFESVVLHPGDAEDALLTFRSKAPLGETANLILDISDGDDVAEGNGQLLTIWKNDSLLQEPIFLPPVFGDVAISIDGVTLDYGDNLYIRLAADETGSDWTNDTVNLHLLVSTTPNSPDFGLPASPPSGPPPAAKPIPFLPLYWLAALTVSLVLISIYRIRR